MLGFKWTSLLAQMIKNLPVMQETHIRSLGWKEPLEKGMSTHSSILARKIPWTEEPMNKENGHEIKFISDTYVYFQSLWYDFYGSKNNLKISFSHQLPHSWWHHLPGGVSFPADSAYPVSSFSREQSLFFQEASLAVFFHFLCECLLVDWSYSLEDPLWFQPSYLCLPLTGLPFTLLSVVNHLFCLNNFLLTSFIYFMLGAS